MNDSIKQLLALQERDLELDRSLSQLAAIPDEIAGYRRQIDETKVALENSKKDLLHLQLARKEKEIDLESKETGIRKHSTDLNAVKSNDAYRALVGEIDKIKKERSELEDEILRLMDQVDQFARLCKEREKAAQQAETELRQRIADGEARQKALEQQISEKQTSRDQLIAQYPRSLCEQYERVRKSKKGMAVVPLRLEQCSGCHMKVSQHLINEVRRGQKLIVCESCSRIVYLEEVRAPDASLGAGTPP